MSAITRALVVLLLLSACSEEPAPSPAPPRPRRQVPEPSRSAVRALPPHEIHVDGVGPYLLKAPLRNVLSRLPHGPRVELVEIPGVVDYSLVRAESGKLVVGVEKPGGVQFISVLASDIAHTAAGVGVKSSVSEVAEKHGARVESSSLAADPAIYRPSTLPGVSLVVNKERVEAVVVSAPPDVALGERPCDGDDTAAFLESVAAASGVPSGASLACFASGRGAFVRVGSRVTVFAEETAEGQRPPRRLAVGNFPNLALAVPLDVDGDGIDELALATVESTEARTEVTVMVAEVTGQKITPQYRTKPYTVDASSGHWYGMDRQAEFLLELSAKDGVVTVSGLYMLRGRGSVSDVMPLLPKTFVAVSRRNQPPKLPADAGPPAAGQGVPADAAMRPGP